MPEPTSQQWLKKLGAELDARQSDLKLYDDYYNGDHRLAFASSRYRKKFQHLFGNFSDNWCSVVVDAPEERLEVEGFRMGADSDPSADKDAWRIWQANNLDAESQIAHSEALMKRSAYALVWANPADDNTPLITIEDALEMVVAHDAANYRLRRAAMKRWQDESGFLFATLYLPDRIEKYQSTARIDLKTRVDLQSVTWKDREGVEVSIENPLGEIPVIPIINRRRLKGQGSSELDVVIPKQDAINKLWFDMLIASEFGSFRQRWATGIEIPLKDGKPVEPIDAALDRLWAVANKDAKFGEFGQTDLGGFIEAIQMAVQHIASQTRTPPHYFLGNMGNFPSGESLKAAETGLVKKVHRLQRHWGESWEEVIRLAFKVLGDSRGNITDSQTIWGNAETRTQSELVDALTKLSTLGVPREALWEEYGYTPQEIARFQSMQATNALLGSVDTGQGDAANA